MSRMTFAAYALNLLKLVDVAFNVVVLGIVALFVAQPPACGNCHYTTSEALAEMRSNGSKSACILCKVLSVLFKPFNRHVSHYDHCTQSMEGMPQSIANS